jgi:hypothetical protein
MMQIRYATVSLFLVLPAMLSVSGCTDETVAPPDDKTGSASNVWFEDQARQRGIDFQYQSGHQGRYLLPETMGGAAALADLDDDGDLDAYLVQGGGLLADASPGNQLFLNNGDGHFSEVEGAGGAGDTGYGMGVATGDYDNDGDVDLYVTNVGPNSLFRNKGNGEFEDVSAIAGVDDADWGTGAAFLDLDSDGDLDLFVVNYLHWSLDNERECTYSGWNVPDYCSPELYRAPARDRLYRNNGDGTFTDVSDAAGLGAAFGNGLGVAGFDADSDGLIDVFVANDMNPNQLWINRGNLQFVDEAPLLGCAVDEHGAAKSGMGVAAADYDDDGDTDLLVMNLATQTDSFFRNEGTHFQDAAATVGIATVTKQYTRFGVALADFDNDVRLDLYEANGAIQRARAPISDDAYAEPDVLLRGLPGPRFERVRPQGGTEQPLIYTSRGVAIGDVNNDGGLDLLVVNRDGPSNLLMNQVASRGNWIRFRVLTGQGRDAHSATVSADVGETRVYRYVQPAGSYLSASDPGVHFGLGDDSLAGNVVVRWPDGVMDAFGDFKAGGTVVLRRGEGKRTPR